MYFSCLTSSQEGSLFPFSACRQTTSRPTAVGIRLIPIYPYNCGNQRRRCYHNNLHDSPEEFDLGGLQGTRINAPSILSITNFCTVNPVAISQFYRVYRSRIPGIALHNLEHVHNCRSMLVCSSVSPIVYVTAGT